MATRKSQLRRSKFFQLFILFGMLVLTLVFANVLIKRRQQLSTSAAAGTAQLFFQPNSAALPPDSTLQIWANVDKPLVFARVTFTFNPTQIRLTKDVELDSPGLTRLVQLTSLDEANNTGEVTFTIVNSPSTTTPLSGTLKLAAITFAPVTSNSDTSLLNFNTADSQLVDSNATPFELSGLTASISLNAPPSPTPSSSDTPDTSGDTLIPLVKITKPTSGSSVRRNTNTTVEAEASDDTGVARVEFIVDDILICTDDTAPYACAWVPRGKPGSESTITARAYDQAGNTSYQTITVNKSR